MTVTSSEASNAPHSDSGHKWLVAALLILLGLAVVRVGLGFVSLSGPWLTVLNFLIGALFLGAPLLAIVVGSHFSWRPIHAGFATVGGFAVQFGCFAIDQRFVHFRGVSSALLIAVGQIGLPIWCAGLGALIATLIRERNLLVPISVFLILYDAFLVLTPIGVTGQVVRQDPGLLQRIAVQIPRIHAGPARGIVEPGALAGPADFVFLAMFMIAIFRFGMRGKETARLVIPVLIGYMIVVQWLSIPLPALVPIGACVIVANRGEITLTRDEKISTSVIALLGIALLTWGFMKSRKPKALPSEPSRLELGR